MPREHLAGVVLDHYGNALSGISVELRDAGTEDAIGETLYEAAAGDDELANPLTTDTNGEFECYLAAAATVDLYVSGTGITARTKSGVAIGGTALVMVARATADTSAYFTAAEYRNRVGGTVTTDDVTIGEQAVAIARFLDLRTHRFFSKDSEVVTRTFDGNGRRKLWLPADIATSTGLIVKVDLNGDYDFDDADETLTLDTHFWLGPADADKGPEPRPWEFLEVCPKADNTVLGVWPAQRRAVQVTAVFGWPSVPAAIKEVAINLTRQLRDILGAGVTMTIENIESAVQMSPQLSYLMKDIQRAYWRPHS